MALSRAAVRGGLWRLGPVALSPPRGRMQSQLVLGVPRSQVCSQLRRSQVRSLSSRATSRALVAAVASAARRVSARYEQYLERSFPRFYVLYSTFKTGIQALFLEAKEIRKIKSKMSQQQLSTQQLPYREMERLRQFRRDVLKAIPIGIIAIPPFANFLVIVLMYFFPRQLLIRYFWTPKQQQEFLDAYGRTRRDVYPDVLRGLARAAGSLPEPQPRELLQQLCAQVQGGAQPHLAQLLAVRSLFSGSVLALNRLRVDHVVSSAQPRCDTLRCGPNPVQVQVKTSRDALDSSPHCGSSSGGSGETPPALLPPALGPPTLEGCGAAGNESRGGSGEGIPPCEVGRQWEGFPHPWKCSRPGWMGLGATWAGGSA
ncbi:LETM1 domain-containing protein 1 isoform 1-T1 [Acridotheres tristis]